MATNKTEEMLEKTEEMLEKTEEIKAEVTTAQEPAYDPWKDMVTVMIPKSTEEDGTMMVAVNGVIKYYPRGKSYRMPRPYADAIAAAEANMEIRDIHKEEMRGIRML